MKTPHRNFVVEFKSGRRQPKTSANSIWGNTDFKALVREVEDETPHLFKSNGAVHKPREVGETLPGQESSVPASEPEVDTDLPPPATLTNDGAEAKHSKLQEAYVAAREAVVQAEKFELLLEPRQTRKETRQKRPRHTSTVATSRSPISNHEARTARFLDAEHPVINDEIEALYSENTRLKKLFAERLILENMQLKKMLERFGSA